MHALAQFFHPSRCAGQPNDLCPTNDTWLELMLGWGARNWIARFAFTIDRDAMAGFLIDLMLSKK
jgi:hypothetical protein